jgi:pimeloyl-ACP methyl ester carboxylesterase
MWQAEHRVRNMAGLIILAVYTITCTACQPSFQTHTPSPTEPALHRTSIPTSTTAPPPAIQRIPAKIKDCPTSDFTCITLTLPLDHFEPENRSTLDVTFGLLPATGQRQGMFVTAVGGPGASGLSSAADYSQAFDPAIREHFDIVFFDQRGIGQSGGLTCPQAAAQFYQADARAATSEQEQALIEAARRFAVDCPQEAQVDPARLRYYNTRQASEDLEAFRQYMGAEQIWLYGESYGTQLAQYYAATHPDRLAGLMLDGPVDLALSAEEFLKQQVVAFDEVLRQTLEACDRDLVCRTDMAAPALSVYDTLAARLQSNPIEFSYTLTSGKALTRELSLAQFESAVAYYLYDEASRVILLRALAAAHRSDFQPLALLVYDSLGLEPDTLEVVGDPAFSDAIYFAVECNDYSWYPQVINPDQRAHAFLRAGDELAEQISRLRSLFYADLPCVFWPASDVEPPALQHVPDIPTLVLSATADPATPVQNARSIYRRLTDGYLILTEGGSHVTFGYGNPCPDDLVTAFLLEGQPPAQRETICPGAVIVPYSVD